MRIIDLYIQEVTRRLPDKSREDIALELRSTIEDMLPDEYTEEEVKPVLEKLGSPAILASGYLDRPMHLIGPRYFDIYISLLKIILPIAAVISLISSIAKTIISYSGEGAVLNVLLDAIGLGIWGIFSTGIQVFFWLTMVFAIIERTDHKNSQIPLTACFKEWTPDDLYTIPYIPKEKAIPKAEVFLGLLWTAIWASVYFNASSLLGVYEKGDNGLEFVMPTFNQEVLLSYWPLVVIVIGLEIAAASYKLLKGQWTRKIAVLNTVMHGVSSIVFIVIISNHQLFNPAFVTYMTDLFSITGDVDTWFFWGAIVTFLLFAAIDIYQGFRKANLKNME
ncbi:HAAS signaling domain-containing protein [Neobacillus sp. NPDC093182]|uniref:HAAS signaling domain-containing protein n=1 Tax=Neobacillus sp. NPDC093182 TaxID=3364297 RepID=UPI0037FD1B8A